VAKPGGEAGWRSREDFGAILENPEAAIHIKEAAEIAEKFEPYLYGSPSSTRARVLAPMLGQ
jgi:hypothetical protein